MNTQILYLRRIVIRACLALIFIAAVSAGCQKADRESQSGTKPGNDKSVEMSNEMSQENQAATQQIPSALSNPNKGAGSDQDPHKHTNDNLVVESKPANQTGNTATQTTSAQKLTLDQQPTTDQQPKAAEKFVPVPPNKRPQPQERNGKTYKPHHLNKNQTWLLLAHEPDIRADFIASTIRQVATPQQQLEAERIAASFDQQYIEILRRRTAILETAMDGDDTDAKLLDLKMDIADLTGRIRLKINQEVLNKEQRHKMHELFLQSQDNNFD